jgi:peptidoglycan/LPS O-acetylase OafA/YrhL
MSADLAPRVRSSPWALRHETALDGLRGLAVAGVVAYHLGLGWARGGFLGVSLFFTLSGFLITNLLLAERAGTGSIRLGAFWARRARRLLPAALAGIALAVVVTRWGGDATQLARLPGDVVGALAYAANWRFVIGHSTYQAGFQTPSPLLHYWSLAIEEQLYLVLPLIVLFAAWRRWSRRRLGALVIALMLTSAAATLLLGGGHDPNRVYFGTDTRMFELLAGVLLAIVVGFPAASGRRDRAARPHRRPVAVAGGAALGGALAATFVLWATVPETAGWLYRGGLCLEAGLSCLLILGAVRGAGLFGALRWRPLAGLGRVSYGVYVYHWPLFLLLTTAHTGLAGGSLIAVRLAATGAVAAASYRWLEQPIRQRRWHLPRLAITGAPAIPAGLLALALVVAGEAPARAVAPVADLPVVVAQPQPARAPEGARPKAAAAPAALRRVLFLGDSLVHQAFPTIAARLRQAGITATAVGGPGVSLMTDRARVLGDLQRAVAADDPDIVVLESCCGLLSTDGPWLGPTGRPVPRGSAALTEDWRALASRATDIARSRGAVVLWVLGPPLHTNGWYGPIDGQVPVVNSISTGVVSCTPGAGTVDWRVLAGPDGQFAAVLPDAAGHLVAIRTSDGFHFTPAGWDAQARITIAAITAQWAADGGRIAGPAGCRL